RKPLWIGLVSIQLLLIIVLQTRAVYLALGGAVLVLAGYLIVENTQQHLKTFKRLGALGLVLLLMVSSLVYFGGSKSNYLQQLNPLTYKASSSGVERLFVWHKTRELIKDNWLLGYGGGNWKIFFPSKSVEGGYRLQEKNIVFTRVHNDFLEVMAETGIMGLLSFIGLFALPILAIFNAYGSAQEWKKRELMILLAALVGYCIISFFDFPKERIEHQSLISILIAYTAFLCRQHFPINLLSIDISAYFRPLLIGLGALFLLNLPTSYYRIVGEYYAVKAINAKIKKNWVELSQVAPLSHSALFNMDAMTLPMKWYEGLGLYQQGQQDEAMVPFEEAFAYNPHNFHVINNFATCLVHKNRFEEAIALFHQALAINPKFDDSIFNLSYCYYSLAQYEEALKWVNKTRSNPGRKAEFLRAIESRLPKNSELQ
ncbi:MAG: O-antigen ligase family protein, partial [Bacteroidota bacterium]